MLVLLDKCERERVCVCLIFGIERMICHLVRERERERERVCVRLRVSSESWFGLWLGHSHSSRQFRLGKRRGWQMREDPQKWSLLWPRS